MPFLSPRFLSVFTSRVFPNGCSCKRPKTVAASQKGLILPRTGDVLWAWLSARSCRRRHRRAFPTGFRCGLAFRPVEKVTPLLRRVEARKGISRPRRGTSTRCRTGSMLSSAKTAPGSMALAMASWRLQIRRKGPATTDTKAQSLGSSMARNRLDSSLSSPF